MSSSYRIDFGRPIPIFPLPGVALLPHGAQPLHLFEPRYRQMVERCLAAGIGGVDTAEPIAMAVIDQENSVPGSSPALRKAVCVGRIVRHVQLPDGRHNIILQGICRARIDELDEPSGERMFRRAWLRPLEPDPVNLPPLLEIRESIRELFSGPRLRRLAAASTVMEYIDRDEVPTHVLLELIGFAVILDDEIRYQLLEEADCRERALVVERELEAMDRLVGQVDRQRPDTWPKGVSFN
ncbi:MAG: LON peptidase substrate-binding domain-containing protein [Phycisphaerales bacterium]|nr:LON peptidase substrate-binding domain-containing protein [Phycisphaerales bacterium]